MRMKKSTKMNMTTRTRTINRSYYCSLKFKYLKIDLECSTTYNCHAATPHPVNLTWLKQNPGQLFNTEINVGERKQMLNNERNFSCEQNCWQAEDRGAISPRLYQNEYEKTHTEVFSYPEIIDLTIGADCNLTCSYCCKEFSSAWRRDIANNGNYSIADNRYHITNKDKVLLSISQPELKTTARYAALLNEIRIAAPHLKKLTVTGGEPLLDNNLIEILESLSLSSDAVIEVYTGLGISVSRFKKMIDQISSLQNLSFIISAENIGKLLEFNRYGIKWDQFVEKINIIKEKNIKFKFQATLSNLSIFGFSEFVNQFKDNEIMTTFAYQPSMMAPHVLDDQSKEYLITHTPSQYKEMITRSIQPTPTESERNEIGIFLQEFVNRRNDLSLDIFPSTFLNWAGIKNVV